MDDEERRLQLTICQYEQAESVAQHSDAVFYEVAAIVWSANVLLLGFMLEVPLKKHWQWPVFLAAVLGVFLTFYVPFALWLTKKGQMLALKVCQQIEREFSFRYRLHNRIAKIYPKKAGRCAVYILTAVFLIVWLCMAGRAITFILTHCEN